MSDHDAAAYGDRIAAVYDESFPHAFLQTHIPPAELDLMASLAALRLRERWGGWEREPFTAQSRRHVSIYERV